VGGIRCYQLGKDEELPDEFCAVKDVSGEPSEYTFYRPETENEKLRAYATKLEQRNVELESDNYELLNDQKDMQFFIDENKKLREVIDDITEVVEVSDPALVEFIAKRIKRARIEMTK